MAFLDWLKERNAKTEEKALGEKYCHDTIGAPGAAARHFDKLTKMRSEPGRNNQKTTRRPAPSWER